MRDNWLVLEDDNGFRVPVFSLLQSELHRRHADHQDKSDRFCKKCQRRSLMTGKELKWISRRASQIAQEATEAQRDRVIQSIPKEDLAKMEAAGVEPVAAWLRFYAAAEIREAQNRGGFTEAGVKVPMVQEKIVATCGE